MKNLIVIVLVCVATFCFNEVQAQLFEAPDGRVGIGTTSPQKKLDIEGGSLRVRFSSTVPYRRRAFDINTTAADPRLESERYIVFFNTPRASFLDIYTKTVFERSDKNDKENIEKLGVSCLTKLSKLDAVKYNWKSDETKKSEIGFLAQDVEEVFPEVVRGAEGIEGKSIAYSHLVPVVVEALKEQQVMIEKQNAMIQNLEAKIAKLEEGAADESLAPSRLFPNIPNPTKGETSIKYYIDEDVVSAEIIILDKNGTLIEAKKVEDRGYAESNINTSNWKNGLYIYTLVIDGKKVDSNKMIVE